MKKLLLAFLVLSTITVMLTGCGNVNGKDLKIIDSGYTVLHSKGKYSIQYAVVINNPNKNCYCKNPKYKIIAKDKNGKEIAIATKTINQINSGETLAFGNNACSLNQKPYKVTFEIQNNEVDWTEGKLDNSGLYSENTVINKNKDGSATVSGSIENSSNKKYENVAVTIVFKNSKDKIVGGYTTIVDKVKADDGTDFSDSNMKADYITDRYEVYLSL